MIDVCENKKCCGCNSCEQICPKNCISFTIDAEGFKYPVVDVKECIDCHLCEKSCPMLIPGTEVNPISVEAMRFLDEQKRLDSSSGGVFTAIAEEIIRKGGVVFGASFTNDWHVVHEYSEDIDRLKYFRGSKYIQSDTSNSYSLVKEFLNDNRWVLFSGTPCQVRGLLLYLKKPYKKLITSDFICHGVPSYDVFMAYICNELRNHNIFDIGQVFNISFRDKFKGWRQYKLTIETKDKGIIWTNKNAFNKGFGANLFLRPSCHNCPSKKFSSGSDFTLADFWGVENFQLEMDDDKGTSLVAIHTKKAYDFIREINLLERTNVNPKDAYKLQTSLFHSMPITLAREEFWNSNWQNDFINVVNKIADRKTIEQRIILSVKYVLRNLGIKKLIKIIRNI